MFICNCVNIALIAVSLSCVCRIHFITIQHHSLDFVQMQINFTFINTDCVGYSKCLIIVCTIAVPDV